MQIAALKERISLKGPVQSPPLRFQQRQAYGSQARLRAAATRWIGELTFGWLGRFRRLARDDERLGKSLETWHWLAAVALKSCVPKCITDSKEVFRGFSGVIAAFRRRF